MRRGMWWIVALLLVINLIYALDIAPEVSQQISEKGEVSVIVILKPVFSKGIGITSSSDEVLSKLKIKDKKQVQGIQSNDYDLDLNHKYDIITGFSGTLTSKGLRKLISDDRVEKIEYDQPVKIFLDQSVPQVNASQAWGLTINGTNITGSGETICVVDTGIDYTHSGLGNCTNTSFLAGNCSKVIAGYDVADDDPDPIDSNSHGTHVAGIVASENSTYRGVAPDAKLIAAKVFSNNSGSTSYSNIIAGIEWCANSTRVAQYNISVITMSIGCDGGSCNHWQTNCDANYSSVAAAVNAAYAQNISITISAGNDGWTNGISDPACLANATPVGAVSSSDIIKYNRGNLLSLLAPSDITSLIPGNTVGYKTGTSMSAPHVAGSIALLQQYYRLTHNKDLLPSQVNQILNSTGKLINDSSGSGLNFSRIDVYAAINSIDNTNISWYSPSNNSYLNREFNLNLTLSDENSIVSSSYNLTNSSGTIIQSNQNNSINQNLFTWTDLVNLSNSTFNEGNYTLSVRANDSLGNNAYSSIGFVVDKTIPSLTITQNHTNPIYNNDTVLFKINVSDVYLNTSAIYFESNFSTNWTNYTMNNENNITFNFTLQGITNLTKNRDIAYRFHALDFAGNGNNSETYNFTILSRNITLINITSPFNGSVLEAGNLTNFTSQVLEPDQDVITYNWTVNGSVVSSTQNFTYQFNTTGNYLVTLTISDGDGTNITNISLMVNDTLAPETTSISYDSSVHLQQDINQSIIANISDYSGVSNVTLYFNNTLMNSSCNTASTAWNCSWSWNGLSVGNYNFTLNITDNFTTPHTNSSTYSFSVTSCSDGSQNGDETGTDCGGSCGSCSSSSSSSSSGGGGSSSGGGSGGTTTTTYIATEPQLNTGYTTVIAKGDRIKFTLEKEEHNLSIESMTSYVVKVIIQSRTIHALFSINDTLKFDLNEDNYNDLSVTLNSINTSQIKAGFTLKTIHELIKGGSISNSVVTNQTQNLTSPAVIENLSIAKSNDSLTNNTVVEVKSNQTYLTLLIIAIAIFLLSAIIYWRMSKKRKRSSPFWPLKS